MSIPSQAASMDPHSEKSATSQRPNGSAIGDWLKQHAIEVLLVGLVGFVVSEVYKLNAMTTGVSALLSAEKERVDRIAAVLPDLRIRVAEEELNRPFPAALIVSKPAMKSNQWTVHVSYIDAETRTRETISLPIAGPNDKKSMRTVLAYFYESKATRLSELDDCAAEQRMAIRAPSFVDTMYSVIFRNPAATEWEQFIAENQQMVSMKHTDSLGTDMTDITYASLIKDLERHSSSDRNKRF